MKSAILLILFNRPDLTEELFSIIETNCEHRKIYIAIDGPRQNNESDIKLCAEVVHLAKNFASAHNDNCRFIIQPKNLGCGMGVKTALDWFFENEEMGIILEDDCHPCADFFTFQDEMLELFKNENDIFIVCGTCIIPDFIKINEGSFVSKYLCIWGWGSWRRSWKLYSFHIEEDDRLSWNQVIKNACQNPLEEFYFLRIFNLLCGKKDPHTWDYQLLFSAWKHHARAILPSRNLVINKGFRIDATHTKSEVNHVFQKIESLQKPILPYLSYDINFDKLIFWFGILRGDFTQFISICNDYNQYELNKTTCVPVLNNNSIRNIVMRFLKKFLRT